MTLLYADTSALVRAYLSDEPDHERLHELLIRGRTPVVTSEVARVEFASAILAAARAGRLDDPELFLERFDGDCEPDGAIGLLRLDSGTALPTAYDLVRQYPLRALDAMHLAVALEEAGREDVTLVTRDADQADAARALGLAVR